MKENNEFKEILVYDESVDVIQQQILIVNVIF